MKLFRNILLPCLIFACAVIPATAKAQHSYIIQLKDSLQASDSSQWLSNDIHLQNQRSETVRLQLTVTLPPKWQVVGKSVIDVVLQPNESKIVPLNLIKANMALAKWQKAEVFIDEAGKPGRASVPFYLRANPVSTFEMQAPITELYVTDNTRTIVLEALVKNTGNIDQQLIFEAKNEFFELNETITRTLSPGEEYLFVNKLKVNATVRKLLLKENIRVSARNKNIKMQSALFVVNNLATNASQHKMPYRGIPVQLETGLMYFGNNFTYYAGVNGAIPLKDSQQILFSYRTKQLGIANTVERNAFSLEYQNKEWKLYAGQLSSTKSFFTFGQGISATYTGKNEHEVNVTGIIHYRNSPYVNDLYSVSMRNKIGKSILLSGAEVNAQKADDRYAYVITNEAQLLRKDNITLSVWANLGQTHYMYKLSKPGVENIGLVYGYSFNYNFGDVQVGSDFQNGTGPYPGVMGGIINQNHRVTWKVRKNIYVDAYYRFNKSNRSSLLFIDTVFNTNFFDYNLEQYGAKARIIAGKNVDFTLGGGKYKQKGSFDRNLLNDAGFVEFASSYRKGRNVSLRLSSTVGFGSVNTGVKPRNMIISRSNLAGNFKFIGFSAFYYRTPRVPNTGFSLDTTSQVTETMSFTPYVNIKMSRTLSGNISYSFAKSLYDQNMTTFAGLNLLYSNKRNGLYATLTGNVPISNTTEKFSSLANNSVILSIRKDLNVPNLTRRRYYNLDITLYKDDNLNLRHDAGEPGLPGATVNIVSQRMFITNNEGRFTFKNVEQKYYVIDLSTVKAPRGYIPAGGFLHYAEVKKNTKLEIPYQRGKVISGNVKVVLDSLASEKRFAPDKIKVMAVDSLGNPYKSMTDKNGDYFINVPAGKYKVTLNPDAFSKDLRPVQLFFFVTFDGAKDEETVNFEIREKKREIRYLKQQ
jgi:hypothetical protein